MTVAELERWAIQRQWNPHRLNWLHLYLRRFTIIPSSPDLCRRWAEVMVAAQSVGRRIECAAARIAASAFVILRATDYAQSLRLRRGSRSDACIAPDVNRGQIHDSVHHLYARGCSKQCLQSPPAQACFAAHPVSE